MSDIATCYVTLYPDVPEGLRITDVLMNRRWGHVRKYSRGGLVPRGWTEDEIDLMMTLTSEDKMSVPAIAKQMGKTIQGVRWAWRKACPDVKRLKSYPRPRRWREKWDPVHLEDLMDNYVRIHRHPAAYFAERFGVSENAIRHAVRNMQHEMTDE